MSKTTNPISLEILKRFVSVKAYCRTKKLHYRSFMGTVHGINPVRYVVFFLKDNEPELFRLLPENAKKFVTE